MTVEEKIEVSLLPTERDVADFQKKGWYVSKPIFSDAEIEEVLEQTRRFYQGEMNREGLPEAFRTREVTYHFPNPGIRKSDYASFFVPALARIVRKSTLGAIAAKLTGSPSIRLWHDQLLWKDPQREGVKANVGWHTDRGYWQCCSSSSMITAWVPFHDCDESVGTITMIEGSHLWPAENDHALNFFDSDLGGLEKKMITGGEPIKKVPMNLKKGQVSFHHCRLIHGSGPNLSEQPRRSVAVHLQDESNRYREFINPKSGNLADHDNGRLCRKDERGWPDFSDPEVCPRLYP